MERKRNNRLCASYAKKVSDFKTRLKCILFNKRVWLSHHCRIRLEGFDGSTGVIFVPKSDVVALHPLWRKIEPLEDQSDCEKDGRIDNDRQTIIRSCDDWTQSQIHKQNQP